VIILALDPGMTTGWAELETTGGSQFETYLLGFGEIPVLGDGIDALIASTRRWLERWYENAPVMTDVAFEGPLNAYSVRTAVELHEVRGAIRSWCQSVEMPHYAYHPSTVKAAVTGKAGATKAMVAAAMKRQFAVPKFPTDHASDAVAIGCTHLIKQYGAKLGDRYNPPPAQDSGAAGGRTKGARGGHRGAERARGRAGARRGVGGAVAGRR
jgi:crossover junction endodeoxyribonuclease RuvC